MTFDPRNPDAQDNLPTKFISIYNGASDYSVYIRRIGKDVRVGLDKDGNFKNIQAEITDDEKASALASVRRFIREDAVEQVKYLESRGLDVPADLRAKAGQVEAAAAPAIPGGYKPTGEPYYNRLALRIRYQILADEMALDRAEREGFIAKAALVKQEAQAMAPATPPQAADFPDAASYHAAVAAYRASNPVTPAAPKQDRRAEIKRELAALQQNYEKRMNRADGAVPPAIKADALAGIARKMDKLTAELKALDEAIEDPFAAAVAHAARDEVPAKPRTPYKLKQ